MLDCELIFDKAVSVGLVWPGLRMAPFREVLHLFLLSVSFLGFINPGPVLPPYYSVLQISFCF